MISGAIRIPTAQATISGSQVEDTRHTASRPSHAWILCRPTIQRSHWDHARRLGVRSLSRRVCLLTHRDHAGSPPDHIGSRRHRWRSPGDRSGSLRQECLCRVDPDDVSQTSIPCASGVDHVPEVIVVDPTGIARCDGVIVPFPSGIPAVRRAFVACASGIARDHRLFVRDHHLFAAYPAGKRSRPAPIPVPGRPARRAGVNQLD